MNWESSLVHSLNTWGLNHQSFTKLIANDFVYIAIVLGALTFLYDQIRYSTKPFLSPLNIKVLITDGLLNIAIPVGLATIISEIISGADEQDSTASTKAVDAYAQSLKNYSAKPRIAYLRQCLESEGLDAEIKQRMQQVIEEYKKAGHTVEAVDFPYLDYLVPTYYVLTTAEASSNLSRFAGVHYGYRSKNATDLESTYKK